MKQVKAHKNNPSLDFVFEVKGSQRQTYTDSQCGFCGCVALSNAFELHFCSYKHVFQRFTSFVGYDRRSFKNCFLGGRGVRILNAIGPIHHFHIGQAIMHHVNPPKICITIVFNVSWDDCKTEEKLETMVMKDFGG